MAARKTAAASAAAVRVIDLDKQRAARAEKRKEQDPITLAIGGETFTLPDELPADFALQAADGRLRESVTALLNGQSERFFEQQPSMEDLTALIEGVNEMYGMAPGEAPASPAS